MARGGVEYLKSIQRLIDYNFTSSDLLLLVDLLLLQSTREKRLAKSIFPRLSAFTSTLEKKIKEADQSEEFKRTSLTVLKNLQYFCDTEIHSERTNSLHRAKNMAENIGHILYIEGSATKLALSAHNGHLTFHPKEEEAGYWLKRKFGPGYYALGYEFNKGNILSFDVINDEVVFHDLTIKPAEKGSLGYLLAAAVGQDGILDFREIFVPHWFHQRQPCSDILGCYGQDGCNERYRRIVVDASFDGIVFIAETVAANRM